MVHGLNSNRQRCAPFLHTEAIWFLDYTNELFVSRSESTMKRFFFHLASKDHTVWDSKGREFSDLAAAHRHAKLLIHKMVTLDESDWRGWSINVTDASYRSVLTVLFPNAYCFQFGKATLSPTRSGET